MSDTRSGAAAEGEQSSHDLLFSLVNSDYPDPDNLYSLLESKIDPNMRMNGPSSHTPLYCLINKIKHDSVILYPDYNLRLPNRYNDNQHIYEYNDKQRQQQEQQEQQHAANNDESDDENNPATCAASNSIYRCISLLIEYKADITLLDHDIYYKCNYKTMKLLLDNNMDPNGYIQHYSFDNFTYTAYSHPLCSVQDYNIVKLLLDYKTNVNHYDDDNKNQSLLFPSRMMRYWQIFKDIQRERYNQLYYNPNVLDSNHDINIQNIALLLLQYNCDINHIDIDRSLLLHDYKTFIQYCDIIPYICQQLANLRYMNRDGFTPIRCLALLFREHIKSKDKFYDNIYTLIQYGGIAISPMNLAMYCVGAGGGVYHGGDYDDNVTSSISDDIDSEYDDNHNDSDIIDKFMENMELISFSFDDDDLDDDDDDDLDNIDDIQDDDNDIGNNIDVPCIDQYDKIEQSQRRRRCHSNDEERSNNDAIRYNNYDCNTRCKLYYYKDPLYSDIDIDSDFDIDVDIDIDIDTDIDPSKTNTNATNDSDINTTHTIITTNDDNNNNNNTNNRTCRGHLFDTDEAKAQRDRDMKTSSLALSLAVKQADEEQNEMILQFKKMTEERKAAAASVAATTVVHPPNNPLQYLDPHGPNKDSIMWYINRYYQEPIVQSLIIDSIGCEYGSQLDDNQKRAPWSA